MGWTGYDPKQQSGKAHSHAADTHLALVLRATQDASDDHPSQRVTFARAPYPAWRSPNGGDGLAAAMVGATTAWHGLGTLHYSRL